MKHLLIPYTQSLADAIRDLDTDDIHGARADIAAVVKEADQDRRAGGNQIANLLEIDPPRQARNYERITEDLRESMYSQIGDYASSHGDLHGLDVIDLAHEEADSATPVYTYQRLIMIAERPEILDADDVEGSADAVARGRYGGEWSFDDLFGQCIYYHLREIAEEAGREYVDMLCENCGAPEESGECPTCDSEAEVE